MHLLNKLCATHLNLASVLAPALVVAPAIVPHPSLSPTETSVPSFARRYNLSCSTCHTVFPSLTEYGKLFRAKGYRLPGAGETLAGEQPLPLGPEVEATGKKRPSQIPFIDIPATSVASFQVISDYRYRPGAEVNQEFAGISSVGLIFGGAMGEYFSFFGNVALIEEGRFEGIDRLFLQYNQGLAFNVRVGQFEPRAIPFSNHRRLLRITPYLNGVFPVIPAQNFFGFSPNQKGVEVFGRLTGPGGVGDVDYSVGLVNGEPGGAFEALEDADGPVGELVRELKEAYEGGGGEFDYNDAKDYYARVNYNTWLRGAFSAGGFFYSGTSGFLLDQEDPESFLAGGNDFKRWGLDARWEQENGYLSLLASVQFFDDKLQRPSLNNPSATVTTGEAQVYIFPWLVPGFRYERVDVDGFPAGFPSSFQRYSSDLLMLLSSNTMLMIGYSWSSERAPDLPLFEEFGRVALHLAF
ncbi:MAG: hypothetical protein ACE5JR_09780 [Gemmatimonadota bacterium]